MAYPTIVPFSALPSTAPSANAGKVQELSGPGMAEVYLDVSGGTVTMALIQYGPGDKWRQRGPQWTYDPSSVDGTQVARIQIPREKFYYGIVKVSGLGTIDAAYLTASGS